jgi:two-component system, NarL family, nitrate/nitrite response regulator NarL
MPTAELDLRVLVVSADPLARAGLAVLLANQPGCYVVGQVSSGPTLSADLDVYQPDVVVWDLGWGPVSADQLEDWRELELPLVALLPDQSQAAAVWSAGALALLLRDSSGVQLAAAITAAAHGLAVFDPEFVPVVRTATDSEHPPAAPADLTPRELDVLRLLAEGLPNKAIALRLNISDHTVKFHINAILGKLHAQSRTEAVVRATRSGLLSL